MGKCHISYTNPFMGPKNGTGIWGNFGLNVACRLTKMGKCHISEDLLQVQEAGSQGGRPKKSIFQLL